MMTVAQGLGASFTSLRQCFFSFLKVTTCLIMRYFFAEHQQPVLQSSNDKLNSSAYNSFL